MKIQQVLSVALIVFALLILSACRQSNGLEFGENSRIQISAHVWIVKTSESTFGLTDEEGFSLVYGNLEKAAFNDNRNKLLVEFKEYLSRKETAQGRTPRFRWVQVDLKTKDVLHLDASPKNLLPIRTFYQKIGSN